MALKPKALSSKLVLLLLAMIVGAAPAVADEATRLRGGWRRIPPYQYRTEHVGVSRLTGLDVEIARAAMRRAGQYGAFEERAWADQLEAVRVGEQDFALAATPTTARAPFAFFSRPYRAEVNVLYVRRSDLYRLDFDEVSDILSAVKQGKFRVALVEGFHYGPQVAELLASPAVERTHSDVQNFESLLAGQVVGLLIDQLEGAFITRQFGWDAQLVEYPVPIYATEITVMFSRVSTSQETVDAFNRGLEEAVAEGEVEAIVRRYKGSRLVSLLLGTTGQPWFFALDLLGTFAFALSGVLLARRSGYDLFGALLLASLPAVGGGVVRDLVVGRSPVGAVSNPIYLQLVLVTVIVSYFLARRSNLEERPGLNRVVETLDALGLAAFTVIGVLVAAEYRCQPLWLWGPVLAALTGAGGGILRDALRGRGDCPSLQGEFYPEVALIWGLVLSLFLEWYVSLPEYQPSDLLYAISACLVGGFITRMMAVVYRLKSPMF